METPRGLTDGCRHVAGQKVEERLMKTEILRYVRSELKRQRATAAIPPAVAMIKTIDLREALTDTIAAEHPDWDTNDFATFIIGMHPELLNITTNGSPHFFRCEPTAAGLELAEAT